MQIFDRFFKRGFFGHLFFHFFDRVKNGRMIFSSKFISDFKEGGVRQFSREIHGDLSGKDISLILSFHL